MAVRTYISCLVALAVSGCAANKSSLGRDGDTNEGARETYLMREGWLFHRGDLEGFSRLPDGVAIEKWRWKAVDGDEETAGEMAAIDLNTDDWETAEAGQDVFHGRVGFTWFRAELGEMPEAQRSLYLRSFDDNATVYLNGKRIVHYKGWNDPFEVDLADTWRDDGPNLMTILVENTDGSGGIRTAVLFNGDPVSPGLPDGVATGFDETAWRAVEIPHDYVVEGTFDPQADKSHGYLPKGVGWYRRDFEILASDEGKQFWIDFEGVYRDSFVWLNGVYLGNNMSGYVSFYYDITDAAKFGETNTLVVRVDAERNEGWWYEGGGIYRHVRLTKLDPLHIAHWGTFVTTPEVKENAAKVNVKTTVKNESSRARSSALVTTIVDVDGNELAEVETRKEIDAYAEFEFEQNVMLKDPLLWSLETPHLHEVRTVVRSGGKTVDNVDTTFGVRTMRFDPDDGLFLNGKPVKVKGTCNHQDFAGVGVALPDRVNEWRIETLLEAGSNGYRTAHNPPTPALLDACDRLGMLVMEENRHLGDSPEILSQVESMVLRDRNHPSIFIWSMSNEEPESGTEVGLRQGKAIYDTIKRLDPTRPVTAAMSRNDDTWGKGLSLTVDVQGCNYSNNMFDDYHKAHPDHPMICTEETGSGTTRGIYIDDEEKAYKSSYASNVEHGWPATAERAFMSGAFIWTGFDYRGEPWPYEWPAISAQFAFMDTSGFPKDDYYYYKANWSDETVLHIFPHWNWIGEKEEGETIEVRSYSNCDRVELFLNGETYGVREMVPTSHAKWDVKWKPGVLLAKCYQGNEVVATKKVETTGNPASVVLLPDRTTINADGEDVSLVAVKIVDSEGRTVPTADNEVTFEINGPGEILGVGNGNPGSLEPDKASKRKAFNGLCMALVQSKTDLGSIKLTAISPGLETAVAEIEARKSLIRPRVAVVEE